MDVKGFRAGRASYPIARLESLSHPGHPPECSHSCDRSARPQLRFAADGAPRCSPNPRIREMWGFAHGL